jgi:two-component system, chemotaxis family, chemotaxis protein CheY
LTCLGGSERGACPCKRSLDCELGTHPEFARRRLEAVRRLWRSAWEGKTAMEKKSWRVLLVDDNEEVRRAMLRGLRMLGHEVTEARDGREAFALLASGGVDLVVTDYEMPKMNGDELCRSVRTVYGLPVILLSGQASVYEVGSTCGAGASHMKPVSMSDLQRSIVQLMEETGARG